ncbi:MAG: hypothetical protein WBF77_04145 [Sulfurimonadaceae bacterium]
MAKCKNCGKQIEPDVEVCPYCDAEVKKGFYATPWIMLAIVIYVIAEIFAGRTVGVEPKSTTPEEVVK